MAIWLYIIICFVGLLAAWRIRWGIANDENTPIAIFIFIVFHIVTPAFLLNKSCFMLLTMYSPLRFCKMQSKVCGYCHKVSLCVDKL